MHDQITSLKQITKDLNLFLSVLLFFLFSSCSQGNKNKIKNTDQFEFVVTGNVIGADGEFLKLIIPSKYPNEEIKTKIENGKYEFKGTLNAPEKVTISVVNKNPNQRIPTPVYLTKDTLQYDFYIGEQYDELTFLSDTVVRSEINKYAKRFDKKYWEAYNDVWVFSDSTKNDSMNRFVYPKLKSEVLNLIEKDLSIDKHSIILLHYLRTSLINNEIFNPDYLSNSEKNRFNEIFVKIDDTYKNNPDYKILNKHLTSQNHGLSRLEFRDYSLINITGDIVNLSDVITKNKYTLVDFWWSGCGSCRKFNQELREYYFTLRVRGVEIIAINVDEQAQKWKNISKLDQIEWVNLYAGNNSTIVYDYGVNAFPTYVIFNKQKEIIELKIKNASDLLELMK